MYQHQEPTLSQQLKARFAWMVLRADTDPSEFWSGLGAVGWGGFLLIPQAGTFAAAPSFAQMATIAPEWVWGLVMFVGGLLQWLAVFREYTRLRLITSFCALLSWGFIAGLIAYSNPYSTGIVTYGVLLTGMNLWSHLRLSPRRLLEG